MHYKNLLFDADNTLFCFDRANRCAFEATCRAMDIPYSEETFACYERCNRVLWEKFDRGELKKDEVVVQRFIDFLRKIGLTRDPEECNRIHLSTLGQCTFLMPHAAEVVRKLSETHPLYLITNAVASVQESRLAKSEIAPYIKAAYISEVAGAGKPSCEYFDYVFSHAGGLTKENCLVIGDSLSSDIQGANNYGLPCCWFNPKGVENDRELRIDYEITDLRELYDIV